MSQEWKGPLKRLDQFRYEIPQSYKKEMRTRGIIYADENLIKQIVKDFAPEQVTNVATMPGVVGSVLAMPDIHWGYGMPVGGVAAFDANTGVISPGSVGYDVNCLDGNTEINTRFGVAFKISDLERRWNQHQVLSMNPTHERLSSRVAAFMKFPRKSALRVRTSGGREIIATSDHPLFTQNGMFPLKQVGNRAVAVFPFSGVPFEEPRSITIVRSEDIAKLAGPKRRKQILFELRKRNLIPLTGRSGALPILLKLFGYLIGDGAAYSCNGRGYLALYGKPEDLEDIRSDLRELGYNIRQPYKRRRSHRITTEYRSYSFEREEYYLKVCANSLFYLLQAMGLPVGNKAKKHFEVSDWIFSLPKWQKRLFLASFFGAELSTPMTMTGHGYNFYCPILSQNKRKGLHESGRAFLAEIGMLVEEFGVKVLGIGQRTEKINENGETSDRFRLRISNVPDNLIKFWSQIGFEYNREKSFLANVAVQYLSLKKKFVEERRSAARKARELALAGMSPVDIAKQLANGYVYEDYIKRAILKGKDFVPRAWKPFPKFDEFIQKATRGLGKTGLVWDTIESIEPVEVDWVYDLTVANRHHNFIANGFLVSNCGVRLIRTDFDEKDVLPKIKPLIDTIFINVPSGVGSHGKIRLDRQGILDVLDEGAKWAVQKGFGWSEDLDRMEANGSLEAADSSNVSQQAIQRGIPQLGSLGAGNHFLEVQKVAEIYDEKVAKRLGIDHVGQVTVLIHTGSRGCGHQIATDYIRISEQAVKKYNIWLPDRQLACAPVNEKEGQDYFKAMCAAANFAWANRQMITHWVRESFEKVFGRSAEELGLEIVYDVAHNMAKLEEYEVDGKKRKVYVHRKGATRAFPAGHPETPKPYKDVGQPVLIPGDMGTCSFVLVGTEGAMKESWGSTCHGAGRQMSRTEATRRYRVHEVESELSRRGIYIHAATKEGIVEEAPGAYKNVEDVVRVCEGAGISKTVAKLVPLGVMKG